eukprot:5610239-Pyramimonas_sp.AAC.1
MQSKYITYTSCTLPAWLQQWRWKSAFTSAAGKLVSSRFCRKCFAFPSKYHSRTRIMSCPCASAGTRLMASITRAMCAQFCISITSQWSAMTSSMDDRKSASSGPPATHPQSV